MNQILALLPILLESLADSEQDFIIAQVTKYLGVENTRIGTPLSPTEIGSVATGLAKLIIAEEKALAAKVKAGK